MSHNTSRTKQRLIARRLRVAELEPYLVPGWQINPEGLQIEASKTVLGFFQRKQQMLLRCRRADCRRRIEVDFRQAVQAGYGNRQTPELLQLLRCRHWDGCRLSEVSAIYPQGVPLVGFLCDENVLISIACATCAVRLLLPPKLVIARLKQAGRGNGATGVLELGRIVRGPCRKCGGRRFHSEVVQPKAPGT